MAIVVRRSYEETMVRPNFNVALKTAQGWLFTRVLEIERTPYEFTRWAAIAPGGTADFIVPRDVNGDEVLRVERLNVITQIFQGWNAPRLRTFQRFPQGVPRGVHPNPRIGNPSLVAAPTFGWQVEGSQSPIDELTDTGMFFLLPFMSMEVGFWNPEGFPVTPANIWFFINFIHQPYNPENEGDAKVIEGILKGKIPATMWGPGIEPFPYPEFERRFEVLPTQYDGQQIYITKDGGQQLIGKV